MIEADLLSGLYDYCLESGHACTLLLCERLECTQNQTEIYGDFRPAG